MRTFTAAQNTLACLLIAAAVLVSGTHAKEFTLVTLPNLWADAKKVDETGQHMVKVATELHHHSDASAKIQSGDGHQADTRSLRLLHEHKKSRAFSAKLGDRLLAWWQLNTLMVS